MQKLSPKQFFADHRVMNYEGTDVFYKSHSESAAVEAKLVELIRSRFFHWVSALMTVIRKHDLGVMRFEFKSWRTFDEFQRSDKKPYGSLLKLSDLIRVCPPIAFLNLQDRYYTQCIIGKDLIQSIIPNDFSTGRNLPPIREVPLDDEQFRRQTRTRHACDNCDTKDWDTKLCSRCQEARYCSLNCQKAHWKTHKLECVKHESE